MSESDKESNISGSAIGALAAVATFTLFSVFYWYQCNKCAPVTDILGLLTALFCGPCYLIYIFIFWNSQFSPCSSSVEAMNQYLGKYGPYANALPGTTGTSCTPPVGSSYGFGSNFMGPYRMAMNPMGQGAFRSNYFA